MNNDNTLWGSIVILVLMSWISPGMDRIEAKLTKPMVSLSQEDRAILMELIAAVKGEKKKPESDFEIKLISPLQKATETVLYKDVPVELLPKDPIKK